MSAPALESALVVLVPEAEPLVQAYRDQHDPAAALGVPAHVTVLYPFHPQAFSPEMCARLSGLFADCAPFDFRLAELRHFPGVLYLAPEPPEPFRSLTRRVVAAFPEFPPYGGQYDEIVPHLTLAQQDDAQRLEAVAAHFRAACGSRLPLPARAEAVVLLDNRLGRWQTAASFRLGARS